MEALSTFIVTLQSKLVTKVVFQDYANVSKSKCFVTRCNILLRRKKGSVCLGNSHLNS